ncbi:hypothetical protein ITJ64_14600 [Herbiconiux sp. VKM Ac-1786]|uniref:hypothetical protein n=1 Tax=Herbiconiux sp. VKM Ac-1786 TaxID=2783824 RepID=UPI00188C3761|nr:hypothetical protein [Herbiconiux sp. VKM Ac-1786]MBF4573746.1 hypothetical protein [Herbiconiux sp. VKM Ac-1786]
MNGAIDREVATAMLVAAYRTCYSARPDYVIWVASPLAGAYAVGLVPLFDALARRMDLSSAEARMVDTAPSGLTRRVAAAVNAQCRGSARAFPRDRQVPADSALWNAVSSRAVSEIGSAGFDEIYWGAYDDAFSSNDHCVSRQLDRDLPDDWFTYRDSTAVGGVFDGIVIDVLREAGVVGLDDWAPFSAAGALVDH